MATTRITRLSATTDDAASAHTRLTGLSVVTHADTTTSSGVFYLADDDTYQPYLLYTIDDLPTD